MRIKDLKHIFINIFFLFSFILSYVNALDFSSIDSLNYNLNIPSGLTKNSNDQQIIWNSASGNNEKTFTISISSHTYTDTQNGSSYVPENMDNIDYKKVFENRINRSFYNLGGEQSPIIELGKVAGSETSYYQIDTASSILSNVTRTASVYADVVIFYKEGYINLIIYLSDNQVDTENVDSKTIELENQLWGIVKSFSLDGVESGIILEEEEEEPVDSYCYDNESCGEGKICSACSECKKPEDLLNFSDLSIKNFKFNANWTSKSIPNTIHNRIILRGDIDMDIYDDKGEKVSACDISMDSMKGLVVKGEIESDDRYSGFINGFLLDVRKKEKECALNFPDPKCALVISPMDRPKEVGVINDIDEKVKITAYKNDEKLFEMSDAIRLTAIDFDVEVNGGSFELQENSSKNFSVLFKNKYTKNIYSKTVLHGYKMGTIEYEDKEGTTIFQNFKPFNKYTYTYYSEEFGNINIGDALAGLSMWDLQKKAAVSSTKDTIANYGGEYLELGAKTLKKTSKSEAKLIGLMKKYFKSKGIKYSGETAARYVQNAEAAKKIAKNYKLISDSYNLGKGSRNLVNLYGSQKDFYKGVSKIKSMSENSGAGRGEMAAEMGVSGIDLLQIGVGIFTLVPNKIPILGKASAGLQSAFSRMTNIWKANLQYIANSSKIERSEELKMPVYITIDSHDDSGWIKKSVIVMSVAYHYLK